MIPAISLHGNIQIEHSTWKSVRISLVEKFGKYIRDIQMNGLRQVRRSCWCQGL